MVSVKKYKRFFDSLSFKIASVTVSTLGYAVFVLLAHRRLGGCAGDAGYLLTVILCGYYWGLVPGIIAGIAGSLLTGFLWFLMLGDAELIFIVAETLFSYSLVGAVTGKLSDNNRRTKNRRTEEPTREYCPDCASKPNSILEKENTH